MNHYNIQLKHSMVSFYATPEEAAERIHKMKDRITRAVVFINSKDGTYGKQIRW